jgi:hypothetical protein
MSSLEDGAEYIAQISEANKVDRVELEKISSIELGKDQQGGNVLMLILRNSLKKDYTSNINKMFLDTLHLFILKAGEIPSSDYSIVYSNPYMDLVGHHYPLIYKLYAVLPKAYRKNLQTVYILNSTLTSRFYLQTTGLISPKFRAKLVFINSILEFQKIIPPTLADLPLSFLKQEDEKKDLKYQGKIASLNVSYDATIGTTRLLEMCAYFIRHNNGLKQEGIFRIPGDETTLSLAKFRLQYLINDGKPYNDKIALSKNRAAILIGDLDELGEAAKERVVYSENISTPLAENNSVFNNNLKTLTPLTKRGSMKYIKHNLFQNAENKNIEPLLHIENNVSIISISGFFFFKINFVCFCYLYFNFIFVNYCCCVLYCFVSSHVIIIIIIITNQ